MRMLAPAIWQRSLWNAISCPPLGPRRSAVVTGGRVSAAAAAAARMGSAGGDGGERLKDPSSNPRVAKIQELINGNGTDGWETCWEKGLTPWDLGQPTPVISHLLETGTLAKGRILIPGCGSGYDVVAIASTEHYVLGMDISESAIKKAREWSASFPNADYFTFLVADFFTWQPTEPFDLIFDYTFFCAIDPSMRPAWAKKMKEILKPCGELITLMYPIGDHAGGPPYSVTVADYEEVLHPVFFKALSIEDNKLAIEPRKGREKLGRWKRCPSQSSL